METDVLGAPYTRRRIALPSDFEGEVEATLVTLRANAPTRRAVLYLHGYVDYFFQTHLAESVDELEAVRRLFPDAVEYLDVYERAGLVRGNAVFAHAIHMDAGAFGRLAAAGAAIACCPSSNAFLGSGAFPLAIARGAGVEIGLGSDVGAGPQLSVLDAARHLAYLGRPSPAEILYRAELGDEKKIKKRIDEYQTRFANPFVAAERGYIDEVIMPHGTRKRVARALQMLRNKQLENPWKKHDNIPL